MTKKLWSIFTTDMDKCFVTGMTVHVERHHIFEGLQGFKSKSEHLGYVVPLHASVHPNGAYNADKNWLDLDHWLKRMCQEHYLKHTGTRDEWYQLFGRFYDDRDDEKVWLNGKFTWEEDEIHNR